MNFSYTINKEKYDIYYDNKKIIWVKFLKNDEYSIWVEKEIGNRVLG